MPPTTIPRKLADCKNHGQTVFVQNSKGYWRCAKCRVDAVTKRRRKCKTMLVDMFGGKCMACGYNRCVGALEFHHINPNEKKFNLAITDTMAFSKLLEEAKKCVLVCSNCHREIEAGLIACPQLP